MSNSNYFDCHSKLNQFYDSKVRLKDKRQVLIEYRDKNIQRVKDGTKLLREEDAVDHPLFVEDLSQGSMAMFTINQAQNDDDHDIDHALVYEEDGCKSDPAEMREFVASAIKQTNGNFKKDPEAQKSAVTVWYSENYHVDLAIYKRVARLYGGYRYYHAGDIWAERDPRAINDWFSERNTTLSPQKNIFSVVTVSQNQVRRLVRLFKFWCSSRSAWSMPSGIILTTLLIENYVADGRRDDVAFINTLIAIRNRLVIRKEVRNPTDASQLLTKSAKHSAQTESLLEKLETHLSLLDSALKEKNATEESARKAWKRFFDNDWWIADISKSGRLENSLPSVGLNVEVSYSEWSHGHSRIYDPWSNQTIPKRQQITFRLTGALSPYDRVEWEVKNDGDEAKWANALALRPGNVEQTKATICHESSAYRGNHTMICRILRNGQEIKIEIPVRIRR